MKIKSESVIEGDIKAVKDLDDWSGPNKWNLHVKDAKGYFRSVQWMHIGNIQPFFNTQLTRYEEN